MDSFVHQHQWEIDLTNTSIQKDRAYNGLRIRRTCCNTPFVLYVRTTLDFSMDENDPYMEYYLLHIHQTSPSTHLCFQILLDKITQDDRRQGLKLTSSSELAVTLFEIRSQGLVMVKDFTSLPFKKKVKPKRYFERYQHVVDTSETQPYQHPPQQTFPPSLIYSPSLPPLEEVTDITEPEIAHELVQQTCTDTTLPFLVLNPPFSYLEGGSRVSVTHSSVPLRGKGLRVGVIPTMLLQWDPVTKESFFVTPPWGVVSGSVIWSETDSFKHYTVELVNDEGTVEGTTVFYYVSKDYVNFHPETLFYFGSTHT